LSVLSYIYDVIVCEDKQVVFGSSQLH